MHCDDSADDDAADDNDNDDANDDYDDNRTGCTLPSTPRAFISFYNSTQLTANWLNKWWRWNFLFQILQLAKSGLAKHGGAYFLALCWFWLGVQNGMGP